MSAAKEIGDFLQAQGQGTVGTDLFEGMLPPEPDTCTSVFERPGQPPIRASAKTIVAERPMIQLLVRSTNYETGYTRIKNASLTLQNFSGILAPSSTRYLEIIAADQIHSVGTDEQRRYMFSRNFRVMKEPS